MQKRKLGKTGIEVPPLTIGSNVFGWTVDEKVSHTLLDSFISQGLNYSEVTGLVRAPSHVKSNTKDFPKTNPN